MNQDHAFIGDIHGNFEALEGLLELLSDRAVKHLVFLGDYINRGPDSSRVLESLIALWESGGATLLAGNHEIAMLDALDTVTSRRVV